MVHLHFIELARLKETGLVTLCRHGIVHLTWHNITIRLGLSDFNRLVRLAARGRALEDTIPLCDEEFCVSIEETEYRVSIGVLDLLLRPAEYLTFVDLILRAVSELRTVMESGRWEEARSAEPLALTPLEVIYPPRFSPN